MTTDPALDLLSTTAPQIRHTVTAIIVAHDGARLLPGLIQSLRAQTYPIEQIVGVDTGSRDRSGAVLAELIGQDAVFGMPRSAGYGQAVAVALRNSVSRRAERTDPNLRRVEWVWLLHDDCEAAPETLERLLRAASRDRSVVVLGPKVLDGQDRRVLREVGISIDRAGRRVTGIEPGEIDQGQHDHNRAVLAVGSAGMLVRRDVWEQLGGFDPWLKLFRDDLDFCWRVQGAGYRVQVVTDAVLYHRELSARRRRDTDGFHPWRLDRRNALWVLALNLPLLTMLPVLAACMLGSLTRAAYFVVTKQVDLAAVQLYSIAGLVFHPIRLWQGRRRRAAGRAEGYAAARTFIPPARTLSKLAEKIAGLLSSGPPQASGGRHQATLEEAEEDAQFDDAQSVLRRVIVHPMVQLFAVLLIVALVAERRLLGTSPLGGGALVPAWGGASALWGEYLAGFHAIGVGSTASAPPYLAVVAALATVLGGQAWLAVDVLLLGCVPLAGLTAYAASRRLVTATPARLLLATSYALLPIATGAVAAGRLGTAVAFILLPLIAVNAGRMVTAPPRPARRAAWSTGLLVAVAAAFAPLTWPLAVLLVLAALAARHWLWAFHPVNAVIVAVTPVAVLFPWSLHLLSSPAAFLAEAGAPVPGLTTAGLSPTALLALSPGGPGLPPVWVTAGLALALLATVLPHRRAGLTIAGWSAAAIGLLAAVAVSRITVTPPGGEPAASWPGMALALAAVGLLVAAAPAAEWLAEIIRNEGGRLAPRTMATGILVVAATAPVLVAGYWIIGGVRGPVGTVTTPLLPAFVAAQSVGGTQYRTLILRPDGAGLDYQVVRQGDPTLGEPELAIAPAAARALSREVAALTAPDVADAGDPGLALGEFGIKYVLMPGPVAPALAQRLDAAVGLEPLSKAPTYDLWQATSPIGRAQVVAADGTVTPLASGPVGVSGATAPAGGGTLVLAEPYGGWTARLNGTALKPIATPVDGWAQGFMLPAGGGKITVSRNNLARTSSLFLELIVVLAVCVLALPGKAADPEQETAALDAVLAARDARRAARAARTARAGGQPSRGRRARPGFAAGLGAGLGAVRLGGGRRRAAAVADGEDLGPEVETGAVPADDGQWGDDDMAGQWQQDDQLDGRDRDRWSDDGQWGDGDQWGESDQRGDSRRWDPAPPRDEPAQRNSPARWDSPLQGTGGQQAAPWETDAQARYDETDRQSAPWELTENRNQWETGDQGPARDSWEDQEAWDSEPQPPAYRTGPQRYVSDRPLPQPTGQQPSERHSHRAGKHGRPSRWRGSDSRSGDYRDGES